MAYNLRLPDALDADARARCERLGISLNALICVALDAYLRGATQGQPQAETPINPGFAGIEPDGAVRYLAGPSLPASGPTPAAAGGAGRAPGTPAKLSKQERRELTRLERLARKG